MPGCLRQRHRHQDRRAGDLIARFATAITEALDPDVAALGDSLDDCETRLDMDDVWELRSDIAQVRVKAISYRRVVQPRRAALEKLAALSALRSRPDCGAISRSQHWLRH